MINISKEGLEKLYWENTNDYVCKYLNVTKVTLLKYIDEAGIKRKGKGGGMVGFSSKKVNITG